MMSIRSLKKLFSSSISITGNWQQQQLRRLNIHEFQPRNMEELEQDIKDAKEDVRVAKVGLAAAKRSGNEVRITAATDAFYICNRIIFQLVEKQLLILKQKPITKSFSEADEDWIASVTGINSKYQNWVERSEGFPNGYVLDEAVKPRDGFKAEFEEVLKVFHMEKEAGRRVLLNLFLSDVVVRFDGVLRIVPELDMVVESEDKRRKLGGKTDYTVGFGKHLHGYDPPKELHLVAQTSIGELDFWQCVAETATLYKSRVDAEKTITTVWGILSNATDWEFIHIDDSGWLWRSKQFHIDLKCYEEAEILPIYRFIHYVVNRCFECCTPPNHTRKPSRRHLS